MCTRVNLVDVKTLTRQHLLSEHREIKRIPNMVKSGRAVFKDIPEKFTLGTGHVKFFYNKLVWLSFRYDAVYDECIKRGFAVTAYHQSFRDAIDATVTLQQFWVPTDEDIAISQERINQKLMKVQP
jgi:deoxyribonuclease (pyrimidine dimer)